MAQRCRKCKKENEVKTVLNCNINNHIPYFKTTWTKQHRAIAADDDYDGYDDDDDDA